MPLMTLCLSLFFIIPYFTILIRLYRYIGHRTDKVCFYLFFKSKIVEIYVNLIYNQSSKVLVWGVSSVG